MASENENKTYTESGISVKIPQIKKSSERLKFLNEKLAIFREIALTTLKIEVESSRLSQYFCFDVLATTGIAGLQWKKHLGDRITVTCGDRSDGCCTRSMCDLNSFKVTDWNQIEGLQRDNTTNQDADCVYVSSLPPKVLLHSEAFDFIYLHVHGNISSYIDSVFSNIRTDGIACLVFPNIASQCFRSPKLIQRQFYAYTQKTVYVTEMAARIVIADIARTAGRHGRAVEVLCTMYAHDHFLLIIKVKKGSQMAFDSVDQCRKVLHCLMCEERVVYPNSHCPVENPYGLLPCECNSKNPGKTAIYLGPMWIGSIFKVPFLQKLEERIKTDFPKSPGLALLNTVITEAICDKDLYSLKVLSSSKTDKCAKDSTSLSDEPALKRQKLDDDLKSENGAENGQESCVTNKSGVNSNGAASGDTNIKYEDMPLFYYHLHQQRYSIVPRSDTVVMRLKESGYRASRTHFEPHSIRTNATLKQMQTIIERTTKHK